MKIKIKFISRIESIQEEYSSHHYYKFRLYLKNHGADDEDEHINVESNVQYHANNEVGEPRFITRRKTSRKLDNIYVSTAKGSNTNNINNNHTLI